MLAPMNSQARPKLAAISITTAVLAGILGGGIYGAIAFGGSSARPATTPTVTVQQAAATSTAQPTATVTKVVTIKAKPKTVQPKAKVNAVKPQDVQPTDPATTDPATDPLSAVGVAGRGPSFNPSPRPTYPEPSPSDG